MGYRLIAPRGNQAPRDDLRVSYFAVKREPLFAHGGLREGSHRLPGIARKLCSQSRIFKQTNRTGRERLVIPTLNHQARFFVLQNVGNTPGFRCNYKQSRSKAFEN